MKKKGVSGNRKRSLHTAAAIIEVDDVWVQ
jgi:hypothetical protein